MMTYEEFRKTHPATRCFPRYTSEQRADHAASFRLGPRQRQAIGEYYYTHEMVQDLAFPTAKMATTRAYAVFVGNTRVEQEQTGLRVQVVNLDEAAEVEVQATAEAEASDATPERLIVR